MTTNAYLSNIKVERVDTSVSPNVLTELEEVMGGVQVGETAPLVDVTHLQSTSREYISGLSDGDEFSLECNMSPNSPSIQQEFIALHKTTNTLRITSTDTSTSPNTARTYTFSAVFLGWSLQPSVGEQDKISFSFKISGGITRT